MFGLTLYSTEMQIQLPTWFFKTNLKCHWRWIYIGIELNANPNTSLYFRLIRTTILTWLFNSSQCNEKKIVAKKKPLVFKRSASAHCSLWDIAQWMLKCNHFRRLLTYNSTTCGKVLRQNNLISIIILIHPFIKKLPNQAPGRCSTILCQIIYAWIYNIHEWISCLNTIPWIILRLPKFSKNQWLLQDCSWVFPMTSHPPLHECHLHCIILST